MSKFLDLLSARSLHNARPVSICRSCRHRIRLAQTRQASSQAALADASSAEPKTLGEGSGAFAATAPPPFDYKIKASVLLSRPPLLTRDLTPFEQAFFFYQKRLNERLTLPFNSYFYFPKGGPTEKDWTRRVRRRTTPARELGKFKGIGIRGWNDELLSSDPLSETSSTVNALLEDARFKEEIKRDDTAGGTAAPTPKFSIKKDIEIDDPQPRATKADEIKDLKSLNRMLNRTLYLVVRKPAEKGKREEWFFPERELAKGESLKNAAEGILTQAGGIDMNTWVVGNMPICHKVFPYSPKAAKPQQGGSSLKGEKVFYMKSRIMAGQLDLTGNELGLQDYRWLCSEEMQKLLHPRHFSAVSHILADR